MPRLVRHDATGPFEVPPQKDTIWICQCGLSQDLPFCDSSHERCATEKTGEVHVYDKARQKIVETRRDE
jgi:CDGSH-type Zn-finger protein